MLRFIRILKQRLVSENRFSRYFLYTIGEISLVVIGILIALQVNNWNENRQSNAFELKMLKEIRSALIYDTDHFRQMNERMIELSGNVDYFVNYIGSGMGFSDSISRRIWGLNSGISIQYNRGPYDAFKASGIDKISNDSLRSLLINIYDFQYPKFINTLEHYNRNHTSDIESIVQFQKDPRIDKSGKRLQIFQEFRTDVLTKPEFLLTLRSIQFRSSRLSRTINEFIPVLERLIYTIEKELNHSNGIQRQ